MFIPNFIEMFFKKYEKQQKEFQQNQNQYQE